MDYKTILREQWPVENIMYKTVEMISSIWIITTANLYSRKHMTACIILGFLFIYSSISDVINRMGYAL